MTNYNISAVIRENKGRIACNRIRKTGMIPAIIYAKKSKEYIISVSTKEIMKQIKDKSFLSSIININIDGNETVPVLLKEVFTSRHKAEIIHIDFQPIDADTKIHQRIPIKFINEDKAPGVKLHGGIINHIITELEIVCLPSDLPSYIEIDLQHLDMGKPISSSTIILPKGVELLFNIKGETVSIASIVDNSSEEESSTPE